YSRGMQLPYLFVAVSLDGKVMGVRFTEAEDGDGLDAQPIAGNPNALATMPMPLNVMIVDATGQATCALISGPGQVSFPCPGRTTCPAAVNEGHASYHLTPLPSCRQPGKDNEQARKGEATEHKENWFRRRESQEHTKSDRGNTQGEAEHLAQNRPQMSAMAWWRLRSVVLSQTLCATVWCLLA